MVALTVAVRLAFGTLSHAETIGVASVTDGDPLEIHGQRIRLHGIDAPQSSQICLDDARGEWRCGQRAPLALQSATLDLYPARLASNDQQ